MTDASLPELISVDGCERVALILHPNDLALLAALVGRTSGDHLNDVWNVLRRFLDAGIVLRDGYGTDIPAIHFVKEGDLE